MSKYNAGTSNVASLVGQKEDIEDIIYDISPTDTPFMSNIGSSTANGILHQWQEDSLAAVAVNAAIEGADADDTAVANTTMKTNRTQIFVKDVSVTNTAEAIGKYGRASEMSYQIAKKGKELRSDIDHAFVGLEQAGAVEIMPHKPTAPANTENYVLMNPEWYADNNTEINDAWEAWKANL